MAIAPWLWRVALLVLVGLNLTVICQGHHEGTRFAGAHILLLGEAGDIAQAALEGPGAPALGDTSIAQHTRLSAVGPSSDGSPLTSDSFVLGAAALLALWAMIGLSAVARSFAPIFKSQTANRPDAPPPRLAFLPISN